MRPARLALSPSEFTPSFVLFFSVPSVLSRARACVACVRVHGTATDIRYRFISKAITVTSNITCPPNWTDSPGHSSRVKFSSQSQSISTSDAFNEQRVKQATRESRRVSLSLINISRLETCICLLGRVNEKVSEDPIRSRTRMHASCGGSQSCVRRSKGKRSRTSVSDVNRGMARDCGAKHAAKRYRAKGSRRGPDVAVNFQVFWR